VAPGDGWSGYPVPSPETWQPGTWLSTVTRPAGITQNRLLVSGECTNFNQSAYGEFVQTFGGAIKGVYLSITAGDCGIKRYVYYGIIYYPGFNGIKITLDSGGYADSSPVTFTEPAEIQVTVQFTPL
jgi:hypothetical protein